MPNMWMQAAQGCGFCLFLQKPHGAWAKLVPVEVQSLYIVRSATCEFSADAK